jgi:hypothetical protein
MRKVIGTALLVAGALLTPSLAVAQTEFGVDVGVVYSKPSGSDGFFQIGTPVDVRVGFGSGGQMMVEPRFTLLFLAGSGETATVGDLGLNVLFGSNHRSGMYLTAGGAIMFASGGGNSATGFSVNGGIGTRSGHGNGGTRIEGFVRYDLESTDLGRPNTLNIGARLGLSFWN